MLVELSLGEGFGAFFITLAGIGAGGAVVSSTFGDGLSAVGSFCFRTFPPNSSISLRTCSSFSLSMGTLLSADISSSTGRGSRVGQCSPVASSNLSSAFFLMMKNSTPMAINMKIFIPHYVWVSLIGQRYNISLTFPLFFFEKRIIEH